MRMSTNKNVHWNTSTSFAIRARQSLTKEKEKLENNKGGFTFVLFDVLSARTGKLKHERWLS